MGWGRERSGRSSAARAGVGSRNWGAGKTVGPGAGRTGAMPQRALPSGSNAAYLLSLAEALRAIDAPDEHVFALEALVRGMLFP